MRFRPGIYRFVLSDGTRSRMEAYLRGRVKVLQEFDIRDGMNIPG